MLQAILALLDWQQKLPRGHRLQVSLEDVRAQPLHLHRNCSGKSKQRELKAECRQNVLSFCPEATATNRRP